MGDVRTIGSGNIGATNVLRTGRKDLAAATLILDALKGTLAVILFGVMGRDAALAAALGAFLGHLFPVWLQFKGGKGVATYLGCTLGLYWPAALIFALVWLLVAYVSRFSSASALAASAVVPLAFAGFGQWEAAAIMEVLTVLLWWKHSPNIARLRAGTEGKIGQKG
jgi:glycerol-3-phosphate acyltransferase PlsY